jgi:hypothetical protein
MKKVTYKIALPLLMLLAGFISCKKDETQTTTAGGSKPALTASAPTFTLTLANANAAGGTFTWTASDYAYEGQIVNYTLQYDTAGNNFANAKEVGLGSNITSKTFKQSELNGFALAGSRISPGATTHLDFRIKAYIGLNGLPVYSDKVTVTINTYDVVVFWSVPGDYQGWDPGSAPKLGSQDLISYEGYVNVPAGGSYEFKITTDPDWNHTNYGSGGPGLLSTSGGNLVWPAGGGYYKVNANKNTLAWSATKTTWGVIGAFNGWASDAAMTYNPGTKKWTATVNFPAGGEFKFRANSDWTINLGTGGPNGTLGYGGGNLITSLTGSHTVTLDLSNPIRYTYSIQ